MAKCTTCGEELEYDAKFCTNCGSKVDSSDINRIENTVKGATSILMKILNFFILLFVGFFVYTIFKVLLSLFLILLVNLSIIDPDLGNDLGYGIFWPLSIILAIIFTPKINNIKTLKNKIIVIIVIIILGLIGVELINTSNRMVRNNFAHIQHSTYSGCLNANQRKPHQTEQEYVASINMCKGLYNITY